MNPALLAEWQAQLAVARRRSPHTVRAYLAAARRLMADTGAESWATLAALGPGDLRQHLARRRTDGLANPSAARRSIAINSRSAVQAGSSARCNASNRP